MSKLQRMSYKDFHEHQQPILAGLNALLDNPRSRRRFRIFAVYDELTGELLAEVFRTTQGSVVVHRSYGRVSRAGNAMFFRQGNDQDDMVVAPFTGDPVQRFHIVSGASSDRGISGIDLIRWVGEGKSRHAISQPTEDPRLPSPTAQMAGWLAENVDAIAASPGAGELYREVQQMVDYLARTLNNED